MLSTAWLRWLNTVLYTSHDHRRARRGVILRIEPYEARVMLSAVQLSEDVRVSASTDDAEENNVGAVNLTSTDLELTEDGGIAQTVGMRFNNISVPNGATILNAYVQFEVDELSTGGSSLTIVGQASDSANAFSTSASNVSSRPTTSASVSWAPPAWNTVNQAGLDQRTPDLSTIIQEIVNRQGWTVDNSLILITTGTGRRAAESYNGEPSAAPLLHIDYEINTIEDTPIASSTDDAEENSGGGVNLNSTDLELTEDAGNVQTVGMRFNHLAIPQGVTITNAYVQFLTDEVSTGTASLQIAAQDADDALTFSSSTSDISSRPTTSAFVAWNPPDWNTIGEAGVNQQTPNLSSVIQEIIDRPGWELDNSLALIVTGTGSRVAESFDKVASTPAVLHVEWDGSSFQQQELEVKHNPRLQLGDAPLDGYVGSEDDQIEILWQTIPTGMTGNDSFTVEYRLVGALAWTAAGPITTQNTGVQSRVIHSAEIDGLDFDTDYEYRVQHWRGDAVLLTTYQDTFHTRLPIGDLSSFTFAAYGDSAGISSIANFRDVQNRINLLDASPSVDVAFSLLLGDNIYNSGSHSESDARFDPTINPEAAAWIATHVDYVGFGNHDAGTSNGLPSEQNFSSPIPVAGVTAPAEPIGETPQHNYSFDYGDVHFVTFDTNSLDDASRLDAQLDWLEADLAASTATWNLVFGHHPVAGVPDKSEHPGQNYYQQVVSRLRAVGADMFLVGHSHTYSWTYPLLGQTGGVADFVLDTDKDYEKGAGLVQLVSGAGGRSQRPGDYSQFPFVASGYTTEMIPVMEDGFARIDVTQTQLTVSYVAADDGAVIDSFTITAAPIVTATTLNNGNANRSGIRELTFTFDKPVTVSSATDLSVFNHTTGLPVDLSHATLLNNGTTAVTWVFSDGPGGNPDVSLTDGRYTAELPATATTTNLAQPHIFEFHKLAGDLDGDGSVNFNDTVPLSINFGVTGGPIYGPGDGDGDGSVNFNDTVPLSINFGVTLALTSLDFGDAPDSATFPTTLANNGARHVITGNTIFLGAAPDAEADGQPTANATGDDVTNGADEDGVVVSGGSLLLDTPVNVTVTATVPSAAVINGWVDFNGDGVWDDAGEQVFTDVTASNGPNVLSITAPGSSVAAPIARFRLTETAGYSYFGLVPNGEVEDYELSVISPPPAAPEALVLGNGDTGISTTAGWQPSPMGYGRKDVLRNRAAGTGANAATWTFTGLTPGTYRVLTTWTAHANRATDAPYTIRDGPSLRTVNIDQQLTPDDEEPRGTTWEDLQTVTITNSTLIVELTNAANGYAIADAVRIQQIE